MCHAQSKDCFTLRNETVQYSSGFKLKTERLQKLNEWDRIWVRIIFFDYLKIYPIKYCQHYHDSLQQLVCTPSFWRWRPAEKGSAFTRTYSKNHRKRIVVCHYLAVTIILMTTNIVCKSGSIFFHLKPKPWRSSRTLNKYCQLTVSWVFPLVRISVIELAYCGSVVVFVLRIWELFFGMAICLLTGAVMKGSCI